MTGLIFLDTETMGLSLMKHDVWEVAWAVDHEPITSGFIPHNQANYEPRALQVNRYWDRYSAEENSHDAEDMLYDTFIEYPKRYGTQLTVVGANPQFDLYRLSRRWGWQEPWSYRAIDISSYAMPILGHDIPQGLKRIADELTALGYPIDRDDATAHTAAGDVEVLRNCYYALVLYNATREE